MVMADTISTNAKPFIMKCGDYEVSVNPKQAWTLSCIRYKGIQVGLDNGYYGTTIRKSATVFTGSGHAEGGAEIISNLFLYQDNIDITPPIPGITYSGSKFSFIKLSRIDNVNLRWTLNIDSNGISESASITPIKEQTMIGMYAFMHPIFTNVTRWIAEDAMEYYEGTCSDSGNWLLRKDIQNLSMYSESDELLVKISYPQIYYTHSEKHTSIWDLKRYHKVYFQAFGRTTLKPGSSYLWNMHFKCSKLSLQDWQDYVHLIKEKTDHKELINDSVVASQDQTVNPLNIHNEKEKTLIVRGKASGQYSRKVWVKFSLKGKEYLKHAPAEFQITYIDSPGYTGQVNIYGLDSNYLPGAGSLSYDWQESNINWSNAPANDVVSGYKVDVSSASLLKKAAITNEVNITNANILKVDIPRLAEYLQPDETVTFILTSYDHSVGKRCFFASQENPYYQQPTLIYKKCIKLKKEEQ